MPQIATWRVGVLSFTSMCLIVFFLFFSLWIFDLTNLGFARARDFTNQPLTNSFSTACACACASSRFYQTLSFQACANSCFDRILFASMLIPIRLSLPFDMTLFASVLNSIRQSLQVCVSIFSSVLPLSDTLCRDVGEPKSASMEF